MHLLIFIYWYFFLVKDRLEASGILKFRHNLRKVGIPYAFVLFILIFEHMRAILPPIVSLLLIPNFRAFSYERESGFTIASLLSRTSFALYSRLGLG